MIARLEEKASEDLNSLVSRIWPEVMNIHPFDAQSNTINYREMLNPCKTGFDACSLQPTNSVPGEYVESLVIEIKWIDDSQGASLDELKRTRQETEDVEENKTKSLIIVDMELVAVKHHRAWVDKADEDSPSLEMYNAMRQTTGSEREAKDQIKQVCTQRRIEG